MNSQRLSEFEQYFQIDESNRVNLFAVDPHAVPKTLAQLEADIPPLFKLAEEVSFFMVNVQVLLVCLCFYRFGMIHLKAYRALAVVGVF